MHFDLCSLCCLRCSACFPAASCQNEKQNDPPKPANQRSGRALLYAPGLLNVPGGHPGGCQGWPGGLPTRPGAGWTPAPGTQDPGLDLGPPPLPAPVPGPAPGGGSEGGRVHPGFRRPVAGRGGGGLAGRPPVGFRGGGTSGPGGGPAPRARLQWGFGVRGGGSLCGGTTWTGRAGTSGSSSG